MFPTQMEVCERFRGHLLEAIRQNNEKSLEMKDLCARFTTDVIGTPNTINLFEPIVVVKIVIPKLASFFYRNMCIWYRLQQPK